MLYIWPLICFLLSVKLCALTLHTTVYSSFVVKKDLGLAQEGLLKSPFYSHQSSFTKYNHLYLVYWIFSRFAQWNKCYMSNIFFLCFRLKSHGMGVMAKALRNDLKVSGSYPYTWGQNCQIKLCSWDAILSICRIRIRIE